MKQFHHSASSVWAFPIRVLDTGCLSCYPILRSTLGHSVATRRFIKSWVLVRALVSAVGATCSFHGDFVGSHGLRRAFLVFIGTKPGGAAMLTISSWHQRRMPLQMSFRTTLNTNCLQGSREMGDWTWECVLREFSLCRGFPPLTTSATSRQAQRAVRNSVCWLANVHRTKHRHSRYELKENYSVPHKRFQLVGT